jgi:hypothetical protein
MTYVAPASFAPRCVDLRNSVHCPTFRRRECDPADWVVFLISGTFFLVFYSCIRNTDRHPGLPRASSDKNQGGAGSGACGRGPVHLALGRLREPVGQLAAGRSRKDAAVERREGARPYVTGARSTSLRCSGAPSFPPHVRRSRLGRKRGSTRVRRSAPCALAALRSLTGATQDGRAAAKAVARAGEAMPIDAMGFGAPKPSGDERTRSPAHNGRTAKPPQRPPGKGGALAV